jgi:hypothetical protein
MTSVADRTDSILNRHLDDEFSVSFCEGDSPGADAVRAWGREFGCHVSEEFVAHSTGTLRGIHVVVREEFWPRPKGGPFWSFLYGLHAYGISKDLPEWMDIRAAAEAFKADSGLAGLPCLRVIGDADIFVFDAAGQIAQWDHETNDLNPIGCDYFELLDRKVGELLERRNRMRGVNVRPA